MMTMSAEVIQQRLLRGQQYANEEFKNLENGLQNHDAPLVDMVNVVYQMDLENAEMENEVQQAKIR